MKRAVTTLDDIGIRPIGYDKFGPKYSASAVNDASMRLILADDFFYRGAKTMNADAQKAIKLTDEVRTEFNESLNKLVAVRQRFVDESKTASGQVRDAADKMAAGLARIEKAADFNRLERYVDLLERAAGAMTTLATLEKDGKLDRIASALK